MKHFVLLVILHYYKKLHRETFCSVKLKYETFCSVKVQYETFRSNDTCVGYGVEALNSDENTIKIAKLTYKYRYLAYVIDSNGYRSREWKDKTHIVLSLDLNTTKSYIL